MNRPLTLTLLATLCLLLNSCITQLQVGEVIRDTPRTDYYGDDDKSVGGVAYQLSPTSYVQQVPVVTRTTTKRVLFFNFFDSKLTSRVYCAPAQQTDELCWIQLSTVKPKANRDDWSSYERLAAGNDKGATIWVKVLNEAPSIAQAKKIDAFKLSDHLRLKSTTVNGGEVTSGQRIAAAPFDYFIDPVMTVPLTVVRYAAAIIASPFIAISSQCDDD